MTTGKDSVSAAGRTARRKARRWPIRLALAAFALAALALAGMPGLKHLAGASHPAYTTVAVTRGDIETTVTALGSLQPKDYVDVGAQVSGQLRKVHVEVGDVVEQGRLLAEIDPTVYATSVRADRARLDDLKAQLAQARAELALARSRSARNEKLYASDFVSRDTLDETRTASEVAEAKIAALQAQVEETRATLERDTANLGYTRIYAPMAGTVAAQTALEGQTLNASQQAPVIVRIANLSLMTVEAQVSEADVPKVRPGMPAYFTTLGLPERRWQGTVRQVKPTPEKVNDVVLYDVLIDVANEDGALMTDMTAQVFFLLGQARNVPLVPLAALKPAAQGGWRAEVLGPGGVESREVSLGLSDRRLAEVVAGLAVGEQVVTGVAGGEAEAARADAAPKGGPRLGPLL